MKKILLIIIGLLIAGYSYSQDHISFNGATFGKPVDEFAQRLNGVIGLNKKELREKGWNPDLCNNYRCSITLNAKEWVCDIRSSRVSDIVWETISVCKTNYLQNDLMLLVKALQEKYGSHVQEKEEDLGEIHYYYYHDGRESGISDHKKEMIAFYFYVKNSSNKVIGEIRISAAPSYKGAEGGFIEISYRDENARALAEKEYNSIMKGSL